MLVQDGEGGGSSLRRICRPEMRAIVEGVCVEALPRGSTRDVSVVILRVVCVVCV